MGETEMSGSKAMGNWLARPALEQAEETDSSAGDDEEVVAKVSTKFAFSRAEFVEESVAGNPAACFSGEDAADCVWRIRDDVFVLGAAVYNHHGPPAQPSEIRKREHVELNQHGLEKFERQYI